jgi:hypothetical protein
LLFKNFKLRLRPSILVRFTADFLKSSSAIASDNGDKYQTEYRTQAGEAVANEFQIGVYPGASVDRTLFNGLRNLPSGAWGSKATDLLALDADITIDISASLDTVTRNLVVDVNTTLINAMEGEFMISGRQHCGLSKILYRNSWL